MNLSQLSRLIDGYTNAPINSAISSDDGMYLGNLDSYMAIGRSAITAIVQSIAGGRRNDFRTILDFGCGYGRVGRHLRAFFRDAKIIFCDVNCKAAQYCAGAFQGVPHTSPRDLATIDFQDKFDLIWVGSEFTHIDFARQQILFDRLINSLSVGGILVATFHGKRAVYLASSGKIRYMSAEKWQSIISDYELVGSGWESYGREELGDWGISLNSLESILALGRSTPGCRLLGCCEAGYGNHQDVVAWTIGDVDQIRTCDDSLMLARDASVKRHPLLQLLSRPTDAESPCAAKPYEYLICMTARTGSTALCSVLDQTGNFGSPKEFLNPRGELQAQIAQLGGGSILEYFDRIKKRYVTPNGCFGMKTSWSDFAPVIELGLFDRMFTNPAIIYLDRRDIVLQAISCYRARESGLWHLADGENALVNRAIRYDGLAIKEFFDALIAEKHEWEEFFCARGIVPLRLYYEDLVGNMGSGVEQIAELLGLTEVAPIAWPLPRVIKLGGAESDEWANRFREQFLTA